MTYLFHSKPLFILDRDGRIIAVFAGKPDDPEWDDVIADLMEAMAQARSEAHASGEVPSGSDKHRRGNYSSFTEGVSLGGGQTVRLKYHRYLLYSHVELQGPGNLVNPPKIRKILSKLLRRKSVRRVCGFQSSA